MRERRAKQVAPLELTLTLPLFPDTAPELRRRPRTYKRITQAIWTEDKAQFIAKYLSYFVQITKHGTYIDGFAGPQSPDDKDSWSAALVLKNEPKWLRHFYLCEISPAGLRDLEALAKRERESKDRHGGNIHRKIEVCQGDFNSMVEQILNPQNISQKEATFCLLDQRTFECHWSTVKKLAAYKTAPANKVELLYFLGVGWLHRAISGIRHEDRMVRWWGDGDWKVLVDLRSIDIAERVRERFRVELGYKYVAAYPIFESKKTNRIMYYMIHASDHEEAPALMVRAHHKAVGALPTYVQRLLFTHKEEMNS